MQAAISQATVTAVAPNIALEMQNISKAFPGVRAVDHVDLHLYKGECLALVGENGAGKSTLMKILGGVYPKDEGIILLKGREVEIHNTSAAQQLGIAFIHQEFNLIEYLPVAENIYLGRETLLYGVTTDDNGAARGAMKVLNSLGANIHPRRVVADLTTGEKQLVEIARALSQNAEILVMDEPTASLTKKEIDVLFSIIHTLKAQGVSVIYISHRLEEIYEIADRVMVMRNGRNAGETSGQAPIQQIVEMMLGREIGEKFHKRKVELGNTALRIEALSTDQGLHDINFYVRKGEILGIFGIAGAGQRELALAIFGLRRQTGGKIIINDKEVSINSAGDAIRNGIGLLTENRKEDGLILEMSIAHNITLRYLNEISPGGYILKGRELTLAASFLRKLKIGATGIGQRVKFLSGGNQQKVVLARTLSTKPDIIMLNEPTRGVDVGAKVEIYDLMSELVAEGKALIMISSELPEVLGMSDRIMVMYRGTLVAEVAASEATQHLLLTYAMGGAVVDSSDPN